MLKIRRYKSRRTRIQVQVSVNLGPAPMTPNCASPSKTQNACGANNLLLRKAERDLYTFATQITFLLNHLTFLQGCLVKTGYFILNEHIQRFMSLIAFFGVLCDSDLHFLLFVSLLLPYK